jgi:hypothetical protein
MAASSSLGVSGLGCTLRSSGVMAAGGMITWISLCGASGLRDFRPRGGRDRRVDMAPAYAIRPTPAPSKGSSSAFVQLRTELSVNTCPRTDAIVSLALRAPRHLDQILEDGGHSVFIKLHLGRPVAPRTHHLCLPCCVEHRCAELHLRVRGPSSELRPSGEKPNDLAIDGVDVLARLFSARGIARRDRGWPKGPGPSIGARSLDSSSASKARLMAESAVTSSLRAS